MDFNADNMDMNVSRAPSTGSGPAASMIMFDPVVIEEFKRGDFTGLTPVMINVVPLSSVRTILGLEVQDGETLAAAS